METKCITRRGLRGRICHFLVIGSHAYYFVGKYGQEKSKQLQKGNQNGIESLNFRFQIVVESIVKEGSLGQPIIQEIGTKEYCP